MSNVPLTASTAPATRRWPRPASSAAPNVNSVPVTVTWLGVIGSRPRSRASRCALRLTHAWKRTVNTRLHLLPTRRSRGLPRPPRLLVDLDHLRRHDPPGIALGLPQARLAEPAAEQPVARQNGKRRA